ncbi:MAG: 16S rRNA (guanine(966)-N(2))-methyltransferase RsmD [Roseburia sp.]|nr:16S rRNA (guanine(966)-N(2))-methyltransferase RsmD [Roseburia sp.]
MRVISGKYKGANIISPHGEVRPTADMVKGSLFSILESKGAVKGARFLDLFCGSGAIGIEALSRGAASCVFVDMNTANVIANLDKLKIESRKLIRGDFRRALRLLRNDKFDVIFCDPPYKSGYAQVALDTLLRYGMTDGGGTIIIEHNSSNDLINVPKDCIIDRRVFGITALEIITRGDNESNIRGDV